MKPMLLVGMSVAEILGIVFVPYFVGLWNPLKLLTPVVWVAGIITVALAVFMVCVLVAFFLFNNIVAEETYRE